MFKKNLTWEMLSANKDEKLMKDAKWSLEASQRALFSYYAYKQVVKSLHIFYIHRSSYDRIETSFKLLNLDLPEIKRGDEDDEAYYQAKKNLILEALKTHHFSEHIHIAVERLDPTNFDEKYNRDEEAWTSRWERECSLFVLSVYFLSKCIEYVETGDKDNLEIMRSSYFSLPDDT